MDIDWYIHLGWNPYPKCERVAIGGAPRFMRGIRLMFAADMHIRDCTSDKYIASLAHMLSAEGADALLLGGDYGESEDAARRFFSAVDSSAFPMGVYGVTGNNDKEAFGDISGLREAFPGRLLINEAAAITVGRHTLYIGGCDERKYGIPLKRSPFPADNSGYSILLSHYPSYPAGVTGPRPRLMLSGHTHAGQIAFMGLSGYTFGMERNTVSAVNGLGTADGIPAFVSSGIGVSRLPIRFCARPRIHIIEFR